MSRVCTLLCFQILSCSSLVLVFAGEFEGDPSDTCQDTTRLLQRKVQVYAVHAEVSRIEQAAASAAHEETKASATNGEVLKEAFGNTDEPQSATFQKHRDGRKASANSTQATVSAVMSALERVASAYTLDSISKHFPIRASSLALLLVLLACTLAISLVCFGYCFWFCFSSMLYKGRTDVNRTAVPDSVTTDASLPAPVLGNGSHRAILRLYFSHFLTQFGDRLWQFAIPILLVSVWRNTLLPSAVFNFMLYTAKLLLLPVVGRCVDTVDRLRLVTWGTFGQSLCISLSASILAIVSLRVDESKSEFGDDRLDAILFICVILIGVVGDLFDSALKLGVEKDWVVVIVDEEVNRGEILQELRAERLAKLNSQLRSIDLLCKTCAPLFCGLAIGLQASPIREVMLGAGIVIAWSLLACVPVYRSWRSVYLEFAALQSMKPEKEPNLFSILIHGGLAYTRHTVFLASLAYCCLYFTVLSDHHPLTTAYLKIDGVSSVALGAARAGGALTGILGAHMYPRLRSKLGVAGTNVFAAWAFVCCIVPVSLLYLHTEPWSARAYTLLIAIVSSRAFLWCFDLANVQTMQEYVEEDRRGEMNGMQAATCNAMELLMATIALFCAGHSQFRILVFASGGGVTLAAVLSTLSIPRRSYIERS